MIQVCKPAHKHVLVVLVVGWSWGVCLFVFGVVCEGLGVWRGVSGGDVAADSNCHAGLWADIVHGGLRLLGCDMLVLWTLQTCISICLTPSFLYPQMPR